MSLAKRADMDASYFDGFEAPISGATSGDLLSPGDISHAMDGAAGLSLDLSDSLYVDDEPELDSSDLAGGEEMVIQIEEEAPGQFSFMLPNVPGGDYQDEIEEPAAEIEVSDEELEVESDPWKWQVSNFCQWLSEKMQGVPRHSGRDSAGIERAMSYLEAVDKEISRAVRQDLNNEIAIDAVEQARDELHKGLERLQERYDKIVSSKYPKRKGNKKKKKAADYQPDLVKEGKAAHIGHTVVTVPLLISAIARTCINSMVSAGKDIEDCFDKLATKYDLNDREELELMQLLADMGYAMRRPRGYKRDEEIDYTSTDNFDYMANYPG